MPTSLLSVNPPPKCPPVSWREIPHLHSTARRKHEETARSLPVPSGVRKTQRVISQHDLDGAVPFSANPVLAVNIACCRSCVAPWLLSAHKGRKMGLRCCLGGSAPRDQGKK